MDLVLRKNERYQGVMPKYGRGQIVDELYLGWFIYLRDMLPGLRLHFYLVLLILPFGYGLKADPIDSLTRLAELPASDSLRGSRYLNLAKAWFGQNPTKTDSLLRVAETFFGPGEYYRGLSDVHNFRANYHYLGGRPLEACSSLDTAMQYAAMDGDSLHMIGIRKNLTILRSEAGDIDGALKAINESILYLQNRDTSLLAQHFVQRGLLRSSQGYRRMALVDFQEAKELYVTIGEPGHIAEAEQRIGQALLKEEENFADALTYFLAAANHYEQAGQIQHYAEVLTLMGSTYQQLHQYASADSSFTDAILLSTNIQQPYNVAHAKLLRAECWLERGIRLPEATEAAAKALPIFQEMMPAMAGNCYAVLARIKQARNQYSDALEDINKGIEIFKSYAHASNLRDAQRLKADLLAQLGQPAEALIAYQRAQTLTDSLFGVERATALSELHLQYETELKDRELALNAAKIKQLAGEQENARLRNRLLIIGMIAALLLLSLSIYSYRLKQSNLEAAVKHRERELAAQRLHLLRKNAFIGEIEEQLKELPKGVSEQEQRKLLSTIRTQDALEQDWTTFTAYFQAVHSDFTQRLEQDFPNLSLTEKRLAYLLRLGTNTAEASAILHIQPESLRKAKYRLKKKIQQNTERNERSLEEVLRGIG